MTAAYGRGGAPHRIRQFLERRGRMSIAVAHVFAMLAGWNTASRRSSASGVPSAISLSPTSMTVSGAGCWHSSWSATS